MRHTEGATESLPGYDLRCAQDMCGRVQIPNTSCFRFEVSFRRVLVVRWGLHFGTRELTL